VTIPEVEGDEAAVSFSSAEGGVGGEPAVRDSGIVTIIGRWRRRWRMMKQRKCLAGPDGPNGQVSQASVAGPVEEKE
jgi:ribosomal protein L16 Arg81 hydroxylase